MRFFTTSINLYMLWQEGGVKSKSMRWQPVSMYRQPTLNGVVCRLAGLSCKTCGIALSNLTLVHKGQ